MASSFLKRRAEEEQEKKKQYESSYSSSSTKESEPGQASSFLAVKAKMGTTQPSKTVSASSSSSSSRPSARSVASKSEYDTAVKKSAVDSFMQRTGVGKALGAPTLESVQRATPESFAARNTQPAPIETPTLDRLQRSAAYDPMTEPGGAAGGISMTARQEAEDREKAARQAYVDAQARMAEVDSNPSYESLQEALSGYLGARQEYNRAETLGDTYRYLDRGYQDQVNADTFRGQIRANYVQGRIGQDSSLAWNEYLDNPTEENYIYATMLDELQARNAENNREALDDVGTILPVFSKDFAQYVPQRLDQIKYGAAGAVAGGVLGFAAGATGAGIKAGITASSGVYSYKTMRGAAYKNLREMGVDDETARDLAGDEAFISSLIEMADTAFDLATLGGGKLINAAAGSSVKVAAAKGAVEKLTAKLTKRVGATAAAQFVNRVLSPAAKQALKVGIGLGLNALGEGMEEYSQEAVSAANEERAKAGRTTGLVGDASKLFWNTITGQDDTYKQRFNEAFRGGAVIALIGGGGEVMVNNLATGAVTTLQGKYVAKSYDGSGADQLINDAIKLQGESAETAKKLQVRMREGKTVTNYELGKLYQQVRDEIQVKKTAGENVDPVQAQTQAEDAHAQDVRSAETVAAQQEQKQAFTSQAMANGANASDVEEVTRTQAAIEEALAQAERQTPTAEQVLGIQQDVPQAPEQVMAEAQPAPAQPLASAVPAAEEMQVGNLPTQEQRPAQAVSEAQAEAQPYIQPEVQPVRQQSVTEQDAAEIDSFVQSYGADEQAAIRNNYHGEQPVASYLKGAAELIGMVRKGVTSVTDLNYEQLGLTQAQADDIYARVRSGLDTLYANNKGNGLVKNETVGRLSTGTQKSLAAIGRALGIRIEVVEKSGTNGSFEASTNTVTIALDGQGTFKGILAHEALHVFQTRSASGYEAFRDTAVKAMMKRHGYSTEQAIIDYYVNRKGYSEDLQRMADAGRDLTQVEQDNYIKDEIAADYATELMDHEDMFRSLMNDSHSKAEAVLSYIKDVFNRLKNKLKGSEYEGDYENLKRHIAMYEQMLAEVSEKDVEPGTQSSDVRFSNKAQVRALDITWVDNQMHLRKQLRTFSDEVSNTENIVDITIDDDITTKELEIQIAKAIDELNLKRITRDNIDFALDKEGLHKALSHAGKRNAAIEATAAAPYILQRGKLICGQLNHKNQGPASLTFAGRATINGTPVIVGVAVKFDEDGRIGGADAILLDGRNFLPKKNKTTSGPRTVLTDSQGTASSPIVVSYKHNNTSEEEINPAATNKAAAAQGAEAQTLTDGEARHSRRTAPDPEKTQQVYKLMRLVDGKLYPLFIDSAAPLEVGTWYDADSPNMDFLLNLQSGVYLVDAENNYQTFDEYLAESGEKKSKLPSKNAINKAAEEGKRWVFIEDTGKAQRRYGGERRKYWNIGINGSGTVSTFAMRPGYHAGSLPSMRQIGKGANKDLRDDRFVWTVGQVPADIDYQAEANRNPDHDIPTHIPTDGYYLKATNANTVKSQADVIGWYVAGSYKIDRIISDAEARQVIDDWNAAHPEAQAEYDYERESGMDFDAEKMELVPKSDRRFSKKESDSLKDSAGDEAIRIENGTAVRYSRKTWLETDLIKLENDLVKRGFDRESVRKWIDDINGVAAYIAYNSDKLDYIAAENQTAMKTDEEYIYSIDFSTLCAKRLLYQGTYDAIQHALPNYAIMPGDTLLIRHIMNSKGYEVPCGFCYVESRRKLLGKFAERWLSEVGRDKYGIKNADVTTTDGLEALRHNNPEAYDDFTAWMRQRGSANPKVVELRTAYGEGTGILDLTPGQIETLKRIGGLRMQSFSDFEIPHVIDVMQVIMDMSRKGLTSQAYTKVPAFAYIFGGTGVKINLSVVADVDENGNLVFDDKEGIDHNEAFKIRDMYDKNCGTILVGKNERQIRAAMEDSRIDFIIPFHRSGWGKGEFRVLGLAGYEDFQGIQGEFNVDYSPLSPQRKKASGFLFPEDYWDYNVSGNENTVNYLKKCREMNRVPRFMCFAFEPSVAKAFVKEYNATHQTKITEDDLLTAKGMSKLCRNYKTYAQKGYRQIAFDYLEYGLDHGAKVQDGYWKTLIDFRMYDKNGQAAIQQTVQPNFNMEYARKFMEEYDGDPNALPVAQDAVAEFVELVKNKENGKYLRRLKDAERRHEAELSGKTKVSEPRYSRKSSAADAKLDRRHQQEVAALKKELDYWKKQTKRTKMNVIDEKAVRKLASDTISFFGANIKAADIQQDLTQLYDILSKTELGDPEYAQADYLALDIAASVIDSVREEVPDPVWNAETRKGVKSYFSGKTITARKTYLDEAAHEFGYENYNELRKALFGKVNLVASENAAAGGASMDDVYLEVSDMFPGVFPAEENMDEATIAVNLVNGIMQAHETAETINPYEVYGGRLEAVMDLAESLINSYIDHTYRLEKEVDADRNYFALSGEAPTAADQWSWKMQDLQADLDNVNGQIKTANEEIARLKKENAANESFRGLADAYGKAVMNLEKDKASLEAELAKAKAQAEKAKARLEAQKQEDKEHYKGISDRSRARTNDRLDRQKDYYTQKILELRAASRLDKEKAIAELKLHNKEIADRARQRKEDSAQRTRLLKLARRLKNKKLDPVTKAFLNEKIGELDLVAKSITGKSRAGLESLAEWYEEQKANPNFIPNRQIEEKIARLGKVQIKSLSQQQVADLVDVLLGIEYQIETQNKFIQSKERSDLFDAVRKTVDSIRRSKGRTAGTAMTAVDRIIADNTLSPLRFVKRIVGYDTTSPLYTLTEDLNDGQRAQMMYEVNAKKPFDRFTNDKKFVRWFTGKDAEEIVIEGTAPGGARSAATITPAMRTALYLHSLNPQNLKHIASGGLKIPDIDLYKKGKYADAYANGTRLKLTRSEITGIVSQMTEQEKAFAREVRNYYNTVSKQALTETYLDLYGFEPDMVEGDYFPIHTDSDFLDRPIEAIKYDGSIEHPGWMNSRVDARNPIMLEDVSDSVNQSITQHGRFVGLAIPVNNFNKLWGASLHGRNDVVDFNRTDTQDYVDANSFLTSVKEALKQKWQTSAARYIESMLQNVQGAYPQTAQDDFSKFIRRIRTNYVQATLTANISVSVKQAASYPTAAAVLGWKPLSQALADRSIYTKQYIERTKELSSKYSPLLAYRSWGYSTTELGDVAKYGRGFTVPTILNTVQYVDILTTSVLWTASEHYVSNNTDLKKGSDEFYKATADIYNRVIEETQPNYTAMQRPPLISGNQNELLRTFFSFKTQPFQNFNIVYDALASYYAAKKAYAAEQSLSNEVALAEARVNVTNGLSAFVAAAATFSAMAFAYSLFRGKTAEYEDDEDEITAKSFTTGFMKSMISGMMGSVPLGAELAEGLSSLIFGDRYYAPEDMAMQAMSDFVSAAKKMVSLIGGLAEGEKPSQQSVLMTVRKFTEKTSALFGVPEANVLNFIGAVYYQAVKAARGKYIGRYWQLALTTDFAGSSAAYYDVLYNAMMNDGKSYNYIYKKLTTFHKADPEKITSAIEKRMVEAQGLESTTELESRYMVPERQEQYDEYMGTAESSGGWNNLDEAEQKKIKDLVYDIVTVSAAGVRHLDKMHTVDLSIEQYIEYKIRLYEADKDKSGSPSQEEFIDAMSRMDLTRAEKSRLWTSNGWKEKNNPYK